jgi:hypothetical protein
MARLSADFRPRKQNLHYQQGDSFAHTFTMKINSEPVDFTGCTALLQIRENFSDQSPTMAPLVELTETTGITLGGNTGVVTFVLTPIQTQVLASKATRARFQLRIVDPSVPVTVSILTGTIRAQRSVIQ